MRRRKYWIASLAGAAPLMCAASGRAAVLSGTAYGYTNLAPINTVSPSSNSSVNTGKIYAGDANTGQGAGEITGNIDGLLTASSHACGEPLRMGGQEADAAGYGSMELQDTFKIGSSTLASGTPVGISFCVLTALHNQENDDLHSSQTDIDVNAIFNVGSSESESSTGDFSYIDNSYGPRTSTTGTLFSGEYDFSLNLTVGQTFEVTTYLVSDSTCGVVPGEIGDVQAQGALVWGAAASLSGITLISSNTGEPCPDMSDCNSTFVSDAVPPPLIMLPEPGVAVAAGVWAIIGLRRRRRQA